MGSDGRLEPRAYGFDWARLLGTGPAPALPRPFLHGDIHQMVGGVHGAELRRRGVRIGAAQIRRLLSGPCSGLDGALRGLDVPCQPLLPPFVLRAGVDHHRAIRRPVERDLALIGFLGCARTVLGWLRVGEDADLFPRVVGHGLGHEPPAFVRRGWEAADAQGVAQRCQIVLGHQRRIGDVDVSSGRDPVLCQERRDVRQEGVVHGFI